MIKVASTLVLTMVLIIVASIITVNAASMTCTWKVIETLEIASKYLYNNLTETLHVEDLHKTLLLTNTKYVIIKDFDLYPLTHYFIYKGFEIPYNFVPIHSIVLENPWIFMYNAKNSMAIFVQFNRSCIGDILERLCEGKISIEYSSMYIIRKCIDKYKVFELNISKILSEGLKNPNKVWNYIVENTSERAAFSIITLVTVWLHNVPSGLLLASELHNHICPGLLSGFLMYRYLTSKKLVNSSEKIYVIASPVYCKDDVYVQLLDATPGKRRIVVKLLSWSEQDKISKILGGNVAGIVIAYNPATDAGIAYILAFNWTRVHAYLKKFNISFHGSTWWISRLVTDIYMLNYINNPAYFVKVLKVIKFKGHYWRYPLLFYELGLAGKDPYVVLGVLKTALKSSHVSVSVGRKATTTSTEAVRRSSIYYHTYYIATIIEAVIIGMLVITSVILFTKYRKIRK